MDHDTAGLCNAGLRQPAAMQRAPRGWGGGAVIAEEPSVERREATRASPPALEMCREAQATESRLTVNPSALS